MNRRRLVTSGIAALVLAVTAACGSTSDPAPNTEVKKPDPSAKVDVTITWWHGQSADAAKLLGDLAREYEAGHPGVTIDDAAGASTTDDLLQKLQAGFASDRFPDICYSYGSWVTELGTSGRTLDIADLVAEADSGWEEFPEGARATATVRDEVVGFPAVLGDLALYYNKDLFDAAGVAYPNADWTWDDFRSAAAAITDESANVYGTAYPVPGSEDTVWRMWPQLWQNGGQVLDETGQPAFNSQAGMDALEYWRQLAVEDKSVYLDQNGEKYSPSFASGNIGMIISGPWLLYDFKKAKTPYGVSILPGTGGDHQTIAGVDVWTLFDHGDEARASAAYDFTRWLTAPEQDVRWNVEYGNLPLRSSAADTPEFAKYVADYPGAQVFFDNLTNAVNPRPTVTGYTEMSRAVGTAISRVLLGEGDPQEELDKAARASAGVLEEE
jgi:multiple sugar transport system substrate-binding protein